MDEAAHDTAWPIPRTRAALHAWLGEHVELEVPTEPLIAGHQSPFDYLCFAFSEDESLSLNGQLDKQAGTADAVVWANRGGGKTFLGAVATMLDMVFKPGIAIRLLGGSGEQSRRMHEHLAELFSREALAELVDGRVTRDRLTLKNKADCRILSQSHTSVRGTRVQKIRCDEVELFDPDVWEAVQLATRSKQCGEVHVRGSIEALSTMHKPYGLMYRIVKEAASGTRQPASVRDGRRSETSRQGEPHADAGSRMPGAVPSRRLFKWGVVDVLGTCDERYACEDDERGPCPLLAECGGRAKCSERTAGHVEVADALDLKARVGEATWNSEMLCLTPSRQHAVLPEFSIARHVVTQEPWAAGGIRQAASGIRQAGGVPSTTDALASVPTDAECRLPGPVICGMDFGFRAPTVIVWAVVDESDALWIVDVRSVADTVLDVHIDAVLEHPRLPKPAWIGVDPAGRQRNDQTGLSNIQQMKKRGLIVRDRPMRIQAGLDLIRARLAPASGTPRLFVHERCTHLIEALERYHYPEDDPESMTPVKGAFDHAVDALRYLVQNLDRPQRTDFGRYA